MALHRHKTIFTKTLTRGSNKGARVTFAVGADGKSSPVRVTGRGGSTRSAAASSFGKQTAAAARAGTLSGAGIATQAQGRPPIGAAQPAVRKTRVRKTIT